MSDVRDSKMRLYATFQPHEEPQNESIGEMYLFLCLSYNRPKKNSSKMSVYLFIKHYSDLLYNGLA